MLASVVVLVEHPSQWPAACAHLRDEGLYPEGVAVAALDTDGHRRAWERAMVRAEPTLVLTASSARLDGWGPALAATVDALAAQPAHVLHLDDQRAGGAYLLTPQAADALLEAAPHDPAPAAAMAGVADVAISAVEPALARAVASGDGDAAEAPAFDDLDRLLRYQDAIALGDGLIEVGDELVSLAFWTPAFCAAVIRAAEALQAWGRDDLDPVPGNEVSLNLISPRLYAHVEDHLAASVVPQLRQAWPTLEFHGLRDAFVIKYEAGGGGLRLHHDVAQVSASVRLNEGYEGGDLVFPRQGATNRGLALGQLLAWPSLVTHPHAAEPVTAGVKYGLTMWFEVPGDGAT